MNNSVDRTNVDVQKLMVGGGINAGDRKEEAKREQTHTPLIHLLGAGLGPVSHLNHWFVVTDFQSN